MKLHTAIRKARFHFVITHGVYVRITRVEATRLVRDVTQSFYWKFSTYEKDGTVFLDFADSNAYNGYQIFHKAQQLPLAV